MTILLFSMVEYRFHNSAASGWGAAGGRVVDAVSARETKTARELCLVPYLVIASRRVGEKRTDDRIREAIQDAASEFWIASSLPKGHSQ
jgi:hypothetical protein